MSMLERAVMNTGQRTYIDVQAELYAQGIDVGETPVRRALRKLRSEISER